MFTNDHQEHTSNRHGSRENSIIYKFLTKKTHLQTYTKRYKELRNLDP